MLSKSFPKPSIMSETNGYDSGDSGGSLLAPWTNDVLNNGMVVDAMEWVKMRTTLDDMLSHFDGGPVNLESIIADLGQMRNSFRAVEFQNKCTADKKPAARPIKSSVDDDEDTGKETKTRTREETEKESNKLFHPDNYNYVGKCISDTFGIPFDASSD